MKQAFDAEISDASPVFFLLGQFANDRSYRPKVGGFTRGV